MRVLITGHCGYIGPVMTRVFHGAGHEVVGFDTGYFRDQISGELKDEHPDFEFVGDIREIGHEVFAGVDAVIHLAALSNDPLGNVAAEQTQAINVGGTRRCAEQARAAGVPRFVLASSCSIYGSAGGDVPIDENGRVAPVTAYARSKVEGEQLLESLQRDDFEPILLRNATAYGASPRMRLDLVLGNVMAYAHATGKIRVLSDGTPWRPLLHIEDLSRAALAAAEAPIGSLPYHVFNVGGRDCNYQVKDIAEIASAALGNCPIEITGENGNDPRSYRVDFTRVFTHLKGYQPTWNLAAGAQEMVRWFADKPKALETLLSERFVRLERLRNLRAANRIDESFRWVPQVD